jgi:hypothetical protein
MENGSTRSIDQTASPRWSAGSQARIVKGGLHLER